MANLNRVFTEELSCPVCLEELNQPKCLPSCAHNVCKSCLEKMLHPEPGIIICPTCRRVSHIPAGGITALPTNTVLVRLLEVTPGRQERLSIQRALDKSRPVVEQMERGIQEIDRSLENLTDKWQQTNEVVHKTASNLVEQIRKQEHNFSNQVQDFYSQKQRILQHQRNNLSTLHTNASGCVTLAEEVLQRGDCGEMAELKAPLTQQLGEIAQMNLANDACGATEEIEFVRNDSIQEALESSGFGQMKSITTNKLDSTLGASAACLDYTKVGKAVGKFGRKGSKRGEFKSPGGVSTNEFGEIAVADYFNNRVQVFDENGKFRFQFGKKGHDNGQFQCPAGLAYTKDNNIAVLDSRNYRVQIFDRTGIFLFKFGKHGSKQGELGRAEGISVDTSGNIIITEVDNNRVQVFWPNGTFAYQFGASGTERFERPLSTAFIDCKFYTSDSGNFCVKVFNTQGEYVRQFGREGGGSGEFKCPRGIAVDRENGNILVCDSENHCVHIFKVDGTFLTKFETKKTPVGIALLKNKSIVVSSYYGNCVQILTYA